MSDVVSKACRGFIAIKAIKAIKAMIVLQKSAQFESAAKFLIEFEGRRNTAAGERPGSLWVYALS